MRVLLDTHILLWALSDDPKLSGKARKLIENAAEIYVCAATFWELAIKVAWESSMPTSMKSVSTAWKAVSSNYPSRQNTRLR